MRLSLQASLLTVSNLDQSIQSCRDAFELRLAARGDRIAAPDDRPDEPQAGLSPA
jgi:hypothetical protein